MSQPFGFVNYLAGQWVTVSSSWVDAVRWVPPDRIEIRTDKGVVLPYEGATEADFHQLLAAPSKGQHVNHVIKKRFRFV